MVDYPLTCQGVWRLCGVRDKTLNDTWSTYGGERRLYVWGDGNNGVLGVGNVIDYSSPVQLPGTSWCQVNIFTSSAGIKTDCTLWAWGQNNGGQSAQNNVIVRSSPVQIPGISWCSINRVCFGQIMFAQKTDNTLWAWGCGGNGAIGDGFAVSRSSPVQVPGTTWCNIKCGTGLKTDGTLWVWGDNNNGQLGINCRVNYSSPVQVPGTTWSQVALSYNDSARCTAFGIKSDGTLWGWGTNFGGSLGISVANNTFYSSPVQVPGTTWSCVFTTYYASGGLKTDGTLWTWGCGQNCVLGQGNKVTSVSSPVQIPGTTWSHVKGGDQHMIARKTDNTLWGWGLNTNGQLGIKNTTSYDSPIQISSTEWSTISCGTTGASSSAEFREV